MIIVALVTFVSLYLYNEYVILNFARSKNTQMRMTVVNVLGGPCIPIIAQCCTSRNILEGIYARRSDIPGGFCFHSDCDLVYLKSQKPQRYFSLKVSKKKK